MSQFYTKDQIDQIATVIGTRIKENSSTRLEPAKDISSFMVALEEGFNPIPNTPSYDIGLAKDYSGTGWYKATDTGIVFNKGVPALETHVFSDSPTEYVSVYTKEDAKLYGERAATSTVTDMSSMFYGDAEFNEDISSWDVSNVTNMSSMFEGTYLFNPDLSSWDTSSVTSMEGMFAVAASFNQDISMWDVSSVTEMSGMFYNASSFNQDLSEWCVSLIPTKPEEFDDSATAWTLPKPVWGTCPRGETPKPRSPNFKFVATDNTGWTGYSKEKLNIQFYGSNGRWKLIRDGITLVQNVSGYRKTSELEMTTSSGGMVTINLFSFGGDFEIVTDVVSRVSLYRGGNTNYETDALSIEVTDFSKQAERHTFELPSVHLTVPQELPRNITSTYEMFKNCTKFNSDISGWDTSRVTDMTSMFDNCHIFNQPIGSWNTSKVETLSSTFLEARSFNQDISLWDVSKVYSFELTFYAATAFNQDLSQWCVTNHPSVEEGRINGFDLDTTSWTLPRPVWGTCPRGEDNPAV